MVSFFGSRFTGSPGHAYLMVQEMKADDSKEPALAVVHHWHWPAVLKR